MFVYNYSLSSTQISDLFTCNDITGCVSDSCSCAGIDTDWEVDMGDYCVLSVDCDLGTGSLNYTGVGNFTVNAVLNVSNMSNPITEQVVYLTANAVIGGS